MFGVFNKFATVVGTVARVLLYDICIRFKNSKNPKKPILSHLKEYLSEGGQCYVICPLVEDSEAVDEKSAA